MKATLLGTGGPLPDPERQGSALVLDVGDQRLLFDCGRGTVSQAARAGIRLDSLDPLFITHHHYDHVSDLADLVISAWLEGRRAPMQIYGPPGTTSLVRSLFESVYSSDLRFRTEGEQIWGKFPSPHVVDIHGGHEISAAGWRLAAAEVRHDPNRTVPGLVWHPLAYRIETPDRSICISGDTVRCDAIVELARGVDVLIQCCYLAESELTNSHLRSLAANTLASAVAAGQIAAEANVGTVVLTHFRRKSSEVLEDVVADVRRSYSGHIVVGSDLLEVVV